jgi:hypothetical protein
MSYECSIHDFHTDSYDEFVKHIESTTHETHRITMCPLCGKVGEFVFDPSKKSPAGKYVARCPNCGDKVVMSP